MNVKTVGKAIYTMLILIVVISVVSMFSPDGSTARVMGVFLCTALLIVCIVLWVAFGRCPYCHRMIAVNLRGIEVCPHCRRNIETGKKKKGKSNRA